MKQQENKARIYKQADGTIKIGGSFINDDGSPLLATKFPWVDTCECDDSEITGIDNVQISLDAGVMSIDRKWEKTIMPPNQVRRSITAKNKDIVAEEIAKDEADLSKLTRATAILNSIKSWSDNQLYVEALKLLKADGTKPEIAAQLQEKVDAK